MWIRGRGEAFRWKPNQLVMRLTTRLLSALQRESDEMQWMQGDHSILVKELTGLGTKLCVKQKNSKK